MECVHEITYVFRLEEFSAKVDMTVPRVSRLQEYESISVHRIRGIKEDHGPGVDVFALAGPILIRGGFFGTS